MAERKTLIMSTNSEDYEQARRDTESEPEPPIDDDDDEDLLFDAYRANMTRFSGHEWPEES